MVKEKLINSIHNSLLNGQRRQMVEEITEYGSTFWSDYKEYLNHVYVSKAMQLNHFSDAVISFHRINGR